ncbi:alpha/beta fold hydrolase [Haloechinothrix sp. LS1_15]|uniref:alpha/beta hydrolase n=1 Tax=Haloechinothrix sp. LS1_15 TaxID=2652248 RepID=UPI002945205A|nr:alpha/beta fold hydrolase [Haloechinothrix sp. LS1_15]MDV6013445.1 alpha/beta fold hydrolase [Haloechinothrix sp. LS1_15]
MHVTPGAESFSYTGSGNVGVLLCHGFTGTPASMVPWGERLASEGFTVRCPRLPGHGTNWRELNRTRWQDWYDCVRSAALELFDECADVFAFGQSMGGTLTLRLGQEFGDRIAGLTLVNPSVTTLRKEVALLPLLSRLVPSVAGLGGDIAKQGAAELSYPRVPLRAAASLAQLWKHVQADLGSLTQPVLLFHSLVDHVVEPMNSGLIVERISSTDITHVMLRNSFHVATLDHDAPRIFTDSIAFVTRVQQSRVEAPA